MIEPNYPKVAEYPKERPNTRTYSVLPARVIHDDKMHVTTLRVLGAICIHTNAHGIAWPSLLTLARHINKRPETVSRHVAKLIKAGYLRKLERKAYPMHIKRKGRGITNRYQVLFRGNDPLPTREQFEAPRPKIVDTDISDREQTTGVEKNASSVIDNRSGGTGDAEKMGKILASTFKKAVESVTGQSRTAEQSLQVGAQLAAKGVTTQQVNDATVAMAKDGLKHGKAAPQNLGQVARWAAL